jgi:hypothetical protein
MVGQLLVVQGVDLRADTEKGNKLRDSATLNTGMTRALLPQIRARPSTPRHNAPSRTRTQFRITMFGPTVVDLKNDLNTAKPSRWQKPPSEPL